eukprot:m.125909 g.125909  ORF g.125909 m.125909 type:complete len:131 (+) comp22157_c0_seq3:81-473(+)
MATPGKFPAGVVELMVNGVVHRIDAAMARERKIDGKFTVVAFLREVLELKGTKLGCGVGGCGVCTVMLTRPVFTGRPQTAAQTETVMVLHHNSPLPSTSPACSACSGHPPHGVSPRFRRAFIATSRQASM